MCGEASESFEVGSRDLVDCAECNAMMEIPDAEGPGPRWAHIIAWIAVIGAMVGIVLGVLLYRGPDVCPCGMGGCPPYPECTLLEGADSTRVLDTAALRR